MTNVNVFNQREILIYFASSSGDLTFLFIPYFHLSAICLSLHLMKVIIIMSIKQVAE